MSDNGHKAPEQVKSVQVSNPPIVTTLRKTERHTPGQCQVDTNSIHGDTFTWEVSPSAPSLHVGFHVPVVSVCLNVLLLPLGREEDNVGRKEGRKIMEEEMEGNMGKERKEGRR